MSIQMYRGLKSAQFDANGIVLRFTDEDQVPDRSHSFRLDSLEQAITNIASMINQQNKYFSDLTLLSSRIDSTMRAILDTMNTKNSSVNMSDKIASIQPSSSDTDLKNMYVPTVYHDVGRDDTDVSEIEEMEEFGVDEQEVDQEVEEQEVEEQEVDQEVEEQEEQEIEEEQEEEEQEEEEQEEEEQEVEEQEVEEQEVDQGVEEQEVEEQEVDQEVEEQEEQEVEEEQEEIEEEQEVEEQEVEEDEEVIEVEEWTFKGTLFFKDTENTVYVNSGGELGDPVGIYDPVRKFIKNITS